MNRYSTPSAFRAALEARLSALSAEQAIALDRLRRQVVFERLLARLVKTMPDTWIVKGGAALEIRLGGRARRSLDLDMATRLNSIGGADLHQQLVEVLATDPFEDWFEFLVAAPAGISPDDAGRAGWRFSVDARLAGSRFESIRMDVVQRVEEIGATSRAVFPALLAFAGLLPVEVELVAPAQHFAEKLHAYTRDYGERPNTRVRDLVDMVLLIDEGLEPDVRCVRIVEHLFKVRGTHPVPNEVPDPPAGWESGYATLSAHLEIAESTLEMAVARVRAFWARTMTST